MLEALYIIVSLCMGVVIGILVAAPVKKKILLTEGEVKARYAAIAQALDAEKQETIKEIKEIRKAL